jgi:hypothetical protein
MTRSSSCYLRCENLRRSLKRFWQTLTACDSRLLPEYRDR